MRIAYEAAAQAMANGMSAGAADRLEKPQVAYAGSMRVNLIKMLDELGLARALDVATSAALFGTAALRTGSVLRFPVFKKGVNYSGYSPTPTKHPALRAMLDQLLRAECEMVAHCPILPLGKTAELALQHGVNNGWLDPMRVLNEFPHPSGANGHRHRQFAAAKAHLSEQLHALFAQSK